MVSIVGVVVLFLLVALVSLKLYITLKSRWCKSKTCLVGKTVIVTGANAGIGYETALEMAKRGARVILACRNHDKATLAKDKIVRETGNINVIIGIINFSYLDSVRNFAENILATEKRLDILINNAGVGALGNKMSEDGLPKLMQVNYFGPVLLTMLLIDLLKKSGPSRIINVSSVLAKKATLSVENLDVLPNSWKEYSNSKLGNILFTMKLAELLKESNISVFSLHPGVIATEIWRSARGYQKTIVEFCRHLYFKTSEEGAQTTLYTALEPGLEKYSGRHFEECALTETYDTARDPNLKENIWKKTMILLNLKFDEKLSTFS